MVQKHALLKETPSQTAGPYVHIGLTPNVSGIGGVYAEDPGATMKTGPVQGPEISLSGHVYDGTGAVVRDALVEIWQPDAAGLFNAAEETRGTPDPNFTGWGRCATDLDSGLYSFDTVKPGRVPVADGRLQAPFITVWIVARGINIGLHTRAYFADEEAANAEDPLLTRIEHRARVPTLMAQPEGDGKYRFDIVLQGDNETIFLDM